jgi:hypothetical protein
MHRDAVLSRPRMWTTVGSDDEAEGSADKEKEPKQDSSSKRSSADGSESPDRERSSHKRHRKDKKEKKERKHKVAHAYSIIPNTYYRNAMCNSNYACVLYSSVKHISRCCVT